MPGRQHRKLSCCLGLGDACEAAGVGGGDQGKPALAWPYGAEEWWPPAGQAWPCGWGWDWAGGQGRVESECFIGSERTETKTSSLGRWDVLEMDGGDGCTTM